MPAETAPLYNHPLPFLESWLEEQGCTQDAGDPSRWHCSRPNWEGVVDLEETAIRVAYNFLDGREKTLVFPYSLSRADVQRAIFETE